MDQTAQRLDERDLLAHAFEYAAIGMVLVDREGRLLKTNRALRRMLGYASQEISQLALWAILHPDEAPGMRTVLASADKALTTVGSSASSMLEHRFLHKTGFYLWSQVSLSPVGDAAGTPQFWIMQLQDISEKKRMEKALRVSNDRIVKVIERMNDIFFVLDHRWQFVYLNQRAEAWFEKDQSQLLGRRWWDLLASADAARIRERAQAAYESKENTAFEIYISAKDQWYQIDLYPGVESISVYLKNIHKFKEAEEALTKSEEGFRELAEHSTDMIARLDEQGRFLYVSPICEHMLGYKRDDMIGTNVHDYVHADDVGAWEKIGADAVSPSDIFTATYRVRRRSGEYLWFESTYKFIQYDKSGHPRQLIAVSRDITERKKIERELIEANDQLSKLTAIDPLTGIANRRIFEEFFLKEWKRAFRTRRPLALLMLDVDFFKQLNDTYGHTYGDDCLKQVAQAIQSALKRPMDMVARYGGEEFAVILPETDTSGAEVVAEDIRRQVEQLRLPHATSQVHKLVTVSIGLASCMPEQERGARELLICADQALYAAKHAGRNCIVVGDPLDGDAVLRTP
ncbi:diguanylate cyclase [Xylanibacillus composti]|uniref:PAS domain S-box-containing protein/diguanylate cyclase (GGDEF)-like protein n=1 Tax=Xylanibacillus composti TaxID=1572762 RepID=A0A8J4H890_9BACL|nr:GGDEF domain-containing protein [Xylanibacillus composti]MDT9724732.1 diguanylate cyclase [Xylanibacillus composti]GIQ70733.1 hypothetical protein XYCOK13_35570 [Xylanibacillus composti]